MDTNWDKLSVEAWKVRNNAHILGKTRVGASVLSESGNIYSGCNIEHPFRSHDIHAEVNAISTLIAAGERKILKILIVAEREFFTPCGGCMDWIMQFVDDESEIGFQNNKNGIVQIFKPKQLMPYYPK